MESEEGYLGARQYGGWYHGDVMALEEQARGVVLHWKMHNVSGEGGGSRVSSSSTIRDGELAALQYQVLISSSSGAGGWSIYLNQRYAPEVFKQQQRRRRQSESSTLYQVGQQLYGVGTL